MERLKLRYDIEAEQEDLYELVALAKDAPGYWQNLRKTCWVRWRDKSIRMVYDAYVDFVVTALPPTKVKWVV